MGIVAEHGAGAVVNSPNEFVAAVIHLALNPSERAALGRSARVAGTAFDVRRLADRYENEIIDKYLD
jgi:hypothetical protein